MLLSNRIHRTDKSQKITRLKITETDTHDVKNCKVFAQIIWASLHSNLIGMRSRAHATNAPRSMETMEKLHFISIDTTNTISSLFFFSRVL